MNALARHLKMERTRFLNPSGIDGKERPYSTAADLARLTRYALAKADFRFLHRAKGTPHHRAPRGRSPAISSSRTPTKLLGTQRIDGVKTGQHRTSPAIA